MKHCPNCNSENIYFHPASTDPNDDFEEKLWCDDCHYYQREIFDGCSYFESWHVLSNVMFVFTDCSDGNSEKCVYIPCDKVDAEISHAGKFWKPEKDFLNEKYWKHDTLLDTHLFLPLVKSPSQSNFPSEIFIEVSNCSLYHSKGWKDGVTVNDWHKEGFAIALPINPDRDDSFMLYSCPVSGARGPNNAKLAWEIKQLDESELYELEDDDEEFPPGYM